MNLVYTYVQFFSSISYLFLAVYVLRKNHKAILNRISSILCIYRLSEKNSDIKYTVRETEKKQQKYMQTNIKITVFLILSFSI